METTFPEEFSHFFVGIEKEWFIWFASSYTGCTKPKGGDSGFREFRNSLNSRKSCVESPTFSFVYHLWIILSTSSAPWAVIDWRVSWVSLWPTETDPFLQSWYSRIMHPNESISESQNSFTKWFWCFYLKTKAIRILAASPLCILLSQWVTILQRHCDDTETENPIHSTHQWIVSTLTNNV